MKIEDIELSEVTVTFPYQKRRIVYLEKGETYKDALKYFTPNELPRLGELPFDETQLGLGIDRGRMTVGFIVYSGCKQNLEKLLMDGIVHVYRKDRVTREGAIVYAEYLKVAGKFPSGKSITSDARTYLAYELKDGELVE